MEADLDLGDKLRPSDKELSGERLINDQYTSQKSTNFQSRNDPVLSRPTTPGQLRQSLAAHTVDTLANSLAIGDVYNTQSDGFQHTILGNSTKTPSKQTNSVETLNEHDQSASPRSNSSASIRSSVSSVLELNNENLDNKS
jgi:hypothetical protein